MPVQLDLENMTTILKSKLEQMVQSANLPCCNLLLVVGEDGGDDNTHTGEFIPKEYLDDADDCALRIGRRRNKKWDIGIVIYKRASDMFGKFPALFTFLLGHELGHAKAYLEKQNIYPLYCLIGYGLNEIQKIPMAIMPHEIMFDKFGMYISEIIYHGVAKLKVEIDTFHKEYPEDVFNFNNLIDLRSSKYVGDCLGDMLSMARPHAKELIGLLNEKANQYKESALFAHTKEVVELLKAS